MGRMKALLSEAEDADDIYFSYIEPPEIPKPKKKDEGEPFSKKHFGDNADAWLEDEPWRTW